MVAQIGDDFIGLSSIGGEAGAVLVEMALEDGAGAGGPGVHERTPTCWVLC